MNKLYIIYYWVLAKITYVWESIYNFNYKTANYLDMSSSEYLKNKKYYTLSHVYLYTITKCNNLWYYIGLMYYSCLILIRKIRHEYIYLWYSALRRSWRHNTNVLPTNTVQNTCSVARYICNKCKTPLSFRDRAYIRDTKTKNSICVCKECIWIIGCNYCRLRLATTDSRDNLPICSECNEKKRFPIIINVSDFSEW